MKTNGICMISLALAALISCGGSNSGNSTPKKIRPIPVIKPMSGGENICSSRVRNGMQYVLSVMSQVMEYCPTVQKNTVLAA